MSLVSNENQRISHYQSPKEHPAHTFHIFPITIHQKNHSANSEKMRDSPHIAM